ncbi:FAD-dependent oxidoreductase [Caulobacter segnis]
MLRYDVTIFSAEPRGEPQATASCLHLECWPGERRPFDDIVINDEAWYRDNAITLHAGRAVTAVDLDGRKVVAEGGLEVAYDKLILATGSDPFRLPLPGADLKGVVTFRDLDDVEAMVEASEGPARAPW